MTTIEQSVKSQSARVFIASDWWLFKQVAESNLKEATRLLRANMLIDRPLQLLARNARKRLLIGVGIELLLKAIYLKHGYVINKPQDRNSLTFPFSAQDAAGVLLQSDNTFTLNELIENLPLVMQLRDKHATTRGLKIAKVFRNKEGHVVTEAHVFEASNYTDVAFSLRALYRDAFGESLAVRFSLAPKENAVWRVAQLSNHLQ